MLLEESRGLERTPRAEFGRVCPGPGETEHTQHRRRAPQIKPYRRSRTRYATYAPSAVAGRARVDTYALSTPHTAPFAVPRSPFAVSLDHA